MSATITTDVHNRLRRLSGLDDARSLMAELNYDPAFDTVPSVTLPESTRATLKTEPQVIARHGDFRVIHTRFNGDRLLLTPEREIVNALRRTNPYSLFLFSDQDDSDWHFVNVKHEGEQPTRTFRRISIGPDERIGERLRTPAEQLAKIALADDEQVAPLDLQARHDLAFDVDVVTKRFYDRYSDVFYRVEAQVQGLEDTDDRRIFTQHLFNRLMFVAFVQKKGWLKLNGNTDYLNELWRSYRQSPDPNGFYRGRLKNLFFVALDNPDGRDYMDGPSGASLRSVLGDVRYLNGGLFEQNAHDQRDDVGVPDAAIEDILTNLFDRFNFTVTESTPLDQEVAVDPEMLGKVFEELVTGRHETGSYYTPKPIVSFMCREALKAYLRSNLPGESESAIEAFVDEHEPDGLRDPEGVLDALRSVTACDPACGSGAYILGLLHELLDLRDALFRRRQVDYAAVYERKLEIIQNNLYGVDIDPFAVNIARLRLWLSLAVDYEGHRPEPLPNLDFKIGEGDSLTVLPGPNELQSNAQSVLTERYLELKSEYLTSHGARKDELLEAIEETKEQIGRWLPRDTSIAGFDWAVEFAEVFASGGFDVVIGNPPYGAKIAKATWDIVCQAFPNARSARNSAAAFLALPARIGSQHVTVSQIVPKSVTYSKGWSKTRGVLWGAFNILSTVDTSEAFANVLLEQEIVTYTGGGGQPSRVASYVYRNGKTRPSGDIPISIMKTLDVIPNHISSASERMLTRLTHEYDSIGRWIKVTRGKGWQRKLVPEGSPSAVPVVAGANIRQFRIDENLQYLAVDEQIQSAVASMQRSKIVCQNIIAHITRPYDTLLIVAALDDVGYAALDTVNLVTTTNDSPFGLPELCALLNSSFARWFYYDVVFNRAVRTMHFDAPYVSKLPIFSSESSLVQALSTHAQSLITHPTDQKYFLPGQNEEYDSIDEIIFELFELNSRERAEILRRTH